MQFKFPPKFPTYNAGLGPRMGRWNQSQVEETWSVSSGGVAPQRNFKVCFSVNGSGGPYVDTGLFLFGQRNVSGLTLNGQALHNGRITYLANVTDEAIKFVLPSAACSSGDGSSGSDICSFLPRPYAMGDAITLISVQGECSKVYDNPIATSGGASGLMPTPAANGVLRYSMQVKSLGPYKYQVCIRGVEEFRFRDTGLLVEVVQNFSLRVLGVPLSASRSDVALPTLTVRLETPIGSLVPYFDSAARPYATSVDTRIILHLYRCNSTCGTLQNALSLCPVSCPKANWENVTHHLFGNSAPIAAGVATFTQLTVQSNAGRFYLQAGWVRDGRLSMGDTMNFVVTPHHIVTSGVLSGDQYEVNRVPLAALEQCDLGLLDIDDVRCRGNAFLPHISVRMVDIYERTLEMLGEDDSFQVVAQLRQGLDGAVDADHTLVAYPGDLILAGFLSSGGLRVNDTLLCR